MEGGDGVLETLEGRMRREEPTDRQRGEAMNQMFVILCAVSIKMDS